MRNDITPRTRSHRLFIWLETLCQDIRVAMRMMRKAPSTSAIGVISIALTIGVTATVFTAIKAVLLNPLPYKNPQQLVQLRSEIAEAKSLDDWIFWDELQEVRRRTRTLQSVAVYGNAVFDLGGDKSVPPEALYGLRMSANLFSTLGVSPVIGRNVLPEEDRPGQGNEMILSYGLWMRRFHGDRNIVGRSVRVNGANCLVIGVMPADFNFPLKRAAAHTPSPYVEFWAPMRFDPTKPNAKKGALGAVARLRSGSSLVEAEQDLASISSVIGRELPQNNEGRILHLGLLADRSVGKARSALWFLLAAAAMFLLIGCANVANLMLSRGFNRQRELSVRMAMGAGAGRVIRQLVTESCVLAIVGGIGGYVIAVAAWKILPAIAPVNIPRLAAAHADWTVLVFAIVLALVNGIVFGMLPALRSVNSFKSIAFTNLSARGASAARQDWIRSSLVAAEVAVTVTLVLIGGQLLGSFIKLISSDPGFDSNRVLASVVLPARERYRTPAERRTVYERFLNGVRSIPGVESAGTVDALPFSGENHGGYISVNQVSPFNHANQTIAEVDVVGGEYLQALGVHLIAGRWFRNEEAKQANDVVLVNDAAARRLWPGQNALGKLVCVHCTPDNRSRWKRVVGVVSTIRHMNLDGPEPINVYTAADAFENAAFLVVRTERSPGEMSRAIRNAIAAIDPDQPVLLSASMRTLVSDSIADRRFILLLLTGTGLLAIVMATAGVYGVAAYTTSRRTQEIGVRVALGATPASIRNLVLQQGLASVVLGFGAGAVLTSSLIRLLQGLLTGFEKPNTMNFAGAAFIVLTATFFACWIPARRAAMIDPNSALRQD